MTEKQDEWISGEVTLSIQGKPLRMQMTVPKNPVKLGRMLPIFQMMTNSVVEISETGIKSLGKEVSCKKGCGACCRQPVPISETEAMAIVEVVENMEEPRKTEIKRRFSQAVKHFQEKGWLEKLESCKKNPSELQHVVMEYFWENIPCPFLEDESCSIHPNRPLACREYIVTSPASNCANPSADNIERVEILFKPSKVLMAIEPKNYNRLPFVPLIYALEWFSENRLSESTEEKQLKKTGEQWLADFFRYLTKSEIPQDRNQF